MKRPCVTVNRKGSKKNELIFFHPNPSKEMAEEQQRINLPRTETPAPSRSRRDPGESQMLRSKKAAFTTSDKGIETLLRDPSSSGDPAAAVVGV